jgi:hypothetical protein
LYGAVGKWARKSANRSEAKMAGVSIDQAPNIDLNAIISGGDEFMKRMQSFRDAKAAAEDAHAKLGIAKNVIEMRGKGD